MTKSLKLILLLVSFASSTFAQDNRGDRKGVRLGIDSFDQLFHDPVMVDSSIEILRRLNPPLIDAYNNFISQDGRTGIWVWLEELLRHDIIRPVNTRTYAYVLNKKFPGFYASRRGRDYRYISDKRRTMYRGKYRPFFSGELPEPNLPPPVPEPETQPEVTVEAPVPPSEFKTLNDLFYDSEMIAPCAEALRAMNPQLIDSGRNYVGSEYFKPAVWIWMEEMVQRGFVRDALPADYARVLNNEFTGLNLESKKGEYGRIKRWDYTRFQRMIRSELAKVL